MKVQGMSSLVVSIAVLLGCSVAVAEDPEVEVKAPRHVYGLLGGGLNSGGPGLFAAIGGQVNQDLALEARLGSGLLATSTGGLSLGVAGRFYLSEHLSVYGGPQVRKYRDVGERPSCAGTFEGCSPWFTSNPDLVWREYSQYDVALEAGVGSVWQWGMFVAGVDWLSVAVPVVKFNATEHTVEDGGFETARRISADDVSAPVAFRFLHGHIGLAF